MKSPVILIANPAAKRASKGKIEKAAELVRSAGHRVLVYLTVKRGDAEDYARKASGCGGALVIAAGGDGTFNEVINGLAGSDARMAILPMGTTNVLAKEIGIPGEVGAAVGVALSGRDRPVSLGKITFTSGRPQFARYFCLMAGIGFDGETVYSVSPVLKKLSGKGAYILSGLKTLAGYSPEELTFAVDGKIFTGYSAIIGKASKYGGNFGITPDARIASPELYAFIMHGKRRADLLRYAFGIVKGKHLGFKDVTYLRTVSVSVGGSARVQLDGDYTGTTPADISVVPDALRLVF
jgi:diacylglycerol kinase (ATP)